MRRIGAAVLAAAAVMLPQFVVAGTHAPKEVVKDWYALVLSHIVVNTPPFPEFPSGHSSKSAAAATVLTTILGDHFAFVGNTDEADGLRPRSFLSFWAAANEAGISRLYGGIHHKAAIELGAEQGKCVAGYAVALKTWRL